MSDTQGPLKGKVILAVDDEPDILEIIEEILEECTVHKASNYDTGMQYLMSYTYDVVILDIMGVNGFELLKKAVSHCFPTVMLTAHALTPESIKKSIQLGAVTFLPKEHLSNLKTYLIDVVLEKGKPLWFKFFDQFGSYLKKRFGPDWEERDRFFKEFVESLSENQNLS